ncbi:ankyrin repeat-containing domain protein [Lophiotrema nucula]|uniref:Ankyrin repeat-containing domain protein n=1 Tax=Lophiotrema nucula TaxID=690887 RepID=A0A6A5ZFQ0_9PLEO|nr:ankyrin repeat-containing domain protein [Lophiotrema nucula]
MKLLDLPPEIFQRIISEHVTQVGIWEAWKHHTVCDTFAVYIKEEIFRRQPIEAFLHNSQSRRLLRSNLVLYLEYHSVALFGAHPLLPSVIKKTVDRLLSAFHEESEVVRAKLTKTVATVFLENSYHSCYWLVIEPSLQEISEVAENADADVALCVAVATQRVDLVEHVLDQGACIWKATYLFGYPLDFAARFGNINIVQLLLSHAETHSQDLLPDIARKIVHRGIMAAGHKIYWNIAIVLAKWLVRVLGLPPKSTCTTWFCKAFSADSLDFLRALLDFGYDARLASLYRYHFLSNSWDDFTVHVMRLLLDRHILDKGELYAIRDPDGEHHTGTLLDFAALRRNVDMVSALVADGADPDGRLDNRGIRSYPLRTALTWAKPNIVKVLLQAGADPEGGNYPMDLYTLDLVSKKSEEYTEVLRAIHQKAERLGADYKPPLRWVWNTALSNWQMKAAKLPKLT